MKYIKYLSLMLSAVIFFEFIFLPIANAGFFARIRNFIADNSAISNAPEIVKFPPQQPQSGPGGSDYLFSDIASGNYNPNSDYEYWIFTPKNPILSATSEQKLPLVVFNHGWIGMEPRFYEAWINHIVKKGNILIFPRYQKNSRVTQENFTPNAIKAVQMAINRLKKDKGANANFEQFAIVGHSIGGIIAANMAALAKKSGLPEPKAVMSVEPGATWLRSNLENLSQISGNTLLLSIAGDKDNLSSDIDAKKIFNETVNIPAKNKNFIIIPSDSQGDPELTADHVAPCGIIKTKKLQNITEKIADWQEVNAIDYTLWKLFDGLRDAALYNKNREYALGNTAQQKSMGIWSDGTPAKELIVK